MIPHSDFAVSIFPDASVTTNPFSDRTGSRRNMSKEMKKCVTDCGYIRQCRTSSATARPLTKLDGSLQQRLHTTDEAAFQMPVHIKACKTNKLPSTLFCVTTQAQWKHVDSPSPRKFRTQPSPGKVMTTIFWDCKGVLLVSHLVVYRRF